MTVQLFAFGGFGVAFIGRRNRGGVRSRAEIICGGHFSRFVVFMRKFGQGFDVLFEELLLLVLLLLVQLVLSDQMRGWCLLLMIAGDCGEIITGIVVHRLLKGEGRTSGGVTGRFVFRNLLDLLDGFDNGIAYHSRAQQGFVL